MSTLTDRYIAEVVRRLPEAQRDDIAAEIAGTVEDMVAAELGPRPDAAGRGPDHDAAELTVLARLGDPAALARQYSGARQYLIGPGVYPVWAQVLRRLLPIVGLIAAVAGGILYASSTPEPQLGGLIAELITSVAGALMWAFTAWTLIVVIVERSTPEGTRTPFETTPDWDPATLEGAPARPETRFDAVSSLVMLALLAAAPFVPSTFLYIGHLNGGAPLVNPALPTFWIAGYLLLIAALALVQVWLLVRPGFQRGRLTVEVVTDVVFGLFLTALVLSQEQLIHPDLVDTVDGGTGTAIRWGIVATIWAVVAWDQVETLRARIAALHRLQDRRTLAP